MKCKKCGLELREGMTFCPKCGTPTVQYKNTTRTQPPQNPYNQNPYNQNPYNQNPYNQNPHPKPHKNNNSNLLIGVLIGLIVLVFILFVIFALQLFGKDDTETESDTAVAETEASTEATTALEENTEQITAATAASTTAATAASTTAVTAASTAAVTEASTIATSEATTASQRPVTNPSYDTYKDPNGEFSIKYPSHFITTDDHTVVNRYTAVSPGGDAEIRIFSRTYNGESADALAAEFERQYGGSEDYYNSGDDFYAVRMKNNGVCYYEYGKIGIGDGVTGFTFIYDASYHDIYDTYVNAIYKSRSWK